MYVSRRCYSFVLLVVLGFHTGSIQAQDDTYSSLHAEDRVIVKYKPTSGKTLTKGLAGFHIINLEGQPLDEAIATFEEDSRVLHVEPDYRVTLLQNLNLDDTTTSTNSTTTDTTTSGSSGATQLTPNDRWWSNQWGHNAATIPTAWSKHTGGNVSVCVIDTGIDYAHKDIAPNYLFGYNAIRNNYNPMDDNGHGTHVSGIIGAVGNNSVGVAGVNWKVNLVGCKALDSTGAGNISISSNSYAIGGLNRQSSILRDAINQAATQDHLFIAAAGNDGQNNDLDTSPSFPAGFILDNIISVAALDDTSYTGIPVALAPYSNYGAQTTHIAAPGTDILSTYPGDYLAYLSGTSMACPFVAAAAALLKAYSGGRLSNIKHIKTALLNSTMPIASLQGKVKTAGMLDVNAAMVFVDNLQASLQPPPSSPPPPPPPPIDSLPSDSLPSPPPSPLPSPPPSQPPPPPPPKTNTPTSRSRTRSSTSLWSWLFFWNWFA